MIGTQILHFRILEKLGEGGMGEVYRALDTRLRREVAVKFLPPRFSSDPEFKRRFEHEAIAAAGLNHPSITTIYELGEHRGRLFIAMELIDGDSLEERIAEGPMAVSEVVDLSIQLCEGLAKAHDAGIIHRDLKPSNILVTRDGRGKILDFGLAASGHRHEAVGDQEAWFSLAYASPEQIVGEAQDARTDLFSFGILLYEMLTGQGPFVREFDDAVKYAIVHESHTPILERRRDVPRQLAGTVDRLLAKSPADRYQRTIDLLADLGRERSRIRDRSSAESPRPVGHQQTIAVLPFANHSNDPKQEYLCEGIAEEILYALARVHGLRVAARTSSFVRRSRPEDIRHVGYRLNAQFVLAGSLTRQDEALRIIASLVRVDDGVQTWTGHFEKTVQDVFSIQEEIASSIVDALQVVLSDREHEAMVGPRTANVQAYDYYLRGRQYLHQGRRQSIIFARQMFEQAIQTDLSFARAYAAAANCSSLLVHLWGESPDADLTGAASACERALALDPELGEAHGARGFVLWLQGRHAEAKEEFETAMNIDPSLFEARYYYGRSCYQRGLLEQAVDLFEDACRVREDYEARYFTAQTYTALERPHRAMAAYRAAIRDIEIRLQLHPDDARTLTIGAVSLCRIGKAREGLEWAERALSIDGTDSGIQYNVACLFALEGQKERALDCLEAAVAAGFAHRDWVENDPDLDSIRDEKRFKKLRWRRR